MPTEAPPPELERDSTSPAALALRAFHSPTATRREREDAAEAMLRAYKMWINRHLRGWPRDRRCDIEELLQESLCRFFDPNKLRPDHPFPEAWLRLTFSRLVVDLHQRRNGPDGLGLTIDAPGPGPQDPQSPGIGQLLEAPRTSGDPADIVGARDLLAKAQRAVLRLRPQDIQMYMLYAEAKPGIEIARQLELDPGVLRQRMLYLRRFLRRVLKLQARGDLA